MSEMEIHPESLSTDEFDVLRRLCDCLSQSPNHETTSGLVLHLSSAEQDETIDLSPRLARAVAATLNAVVEGHSVRVGDSDSELTTSQAADLLNVSRPFLIGLLEKGKLPHRKVGTHRRLRRRDVVQYRARMYNDQHQALQALSDQAQELGLGYE
jgi:excisionase family DNA binding protein